MTPAVGEGGATPAEFLFELASADRLEILSLLGPGPARLTELARKLSATDPEASRHLGRLTKAGLVAKRPDGAFALTTLGRLTRDLLPAFSVLAGRREYLLTHDLSAVPRELLERIGELAEHRFLDHLDEVLGAIGRVTSEAREFVWIMTERPVHLEHKHAHPASLTVRVTIPRPFDDELKRLLGQNWPGAKVDLAHVDSVPANLLVSEQQACVLFRGLDGRVDFNQGIAGESPAFRGWCRALFDAVAAPARRALQ